MKLASALAALVLAVVPSADKLAFGAKEGTKLAKTFESHMEMEKRSMTISIGGNELPAELGEKATMEMNEDKTVEVEDEYRKTGDDRPLLLARHYTTLKKKTGSNMDMHMPGQEAKEETKEPESKLEGKTVLFRWDAEKEKYAREWVGAGADDELLAGVEEDMDLRRLLPSKSVSVGDTWTIDLKEFGEILGPGGKLGFDDKDDNDDEFEEHLKGEATCTYKGEREVDGKKLARIATVCKASTFQDKEEETGQKVHMTFELELEGEFLWNVAGKHLESYEMSGDITSKLEMKQELEMQGRKAELLVTIDLAGKMTEKATFEEK
jgi:hypothetical protein